MHRSIFRVAALVLAFALLLGCAPGITDDKPYLEIRDGFARTLASESKLNSSEPEAWKTPVGPLGLGPNGLIFMTIENKGGAGDRLIKASTPVAEAVELHQMVLSWETTNSYPVPAIDLPARTVTALESGAFYIRLVGMKKNLPNGSKFDLTLEFEKSGERKVEIVVGNP